MFCRWIEDYITDPDSRYGEWFLSAAERLVGRYLAWIERLKGGE